MPSSRDLRKFGVTVGLAFLVLGTLSAYRGHVVPPRVLWSAGAVLLAGGVLAPARLAGVHRRWMAFAEALGWINTRILLGALFFLVVTPIGVVMRWFRDPLDRSMSTGAKTSWVRREPTPVDRARYEQQF